MIVFAVFSGLMIVLDQLMKFWATAKLAPIGQQELIPSVLGLRYVLNDGMAFSLLGGARWPLVVVTSIALAAVLGYVILKKPKGILFWSTACIFAGGIGNLIDRIRTGVVVDFLEFRFMEFPVFNFADILVCVGAGLLFLWAILDAVQESKQSKQQEKNNGAA